MGAAPPLPVIPSVRSVIPVDRRAHVTVVPLDSAETTTVLRVPETGISLHALERALIVFALTRTSGNRTRAARLLGLTRSALLYRLHKHGLGDLASANRDATSVESL